MHQLCCVAVYVVLLNHGSDTEDLIFIFKNVSRCNMVNMNHIISEMWNCARFVINTGTVLFLDVSVVSLRRGFVQSTAGGLLVDSDEIKLF